MYKQAVELTHQALFYNQGQNCCAGSRLFVHSSLHDEMAARLTERAKKRIVGDPFLEDTEQGPQVDEAQMKKILGYIDLGQQQGANLHFGALARSCSAGLVVLIWGRTTLASTG